MSWLYMISAIFLEVFGTTCMKLSQGFTRIGPSILVFILYGLSLGFLTLALKKIDISVAYAVWSGLGTALIATIGFLWFKEPMNVYRVVCLFLIILGVVGLHLNPGVR